MSTGTEQWGLLLVSCKNDPERRVVIISRDRNPRGPWSIPGDPLESGSVSPDVQVIAKAKLQTGIKGFDHPPIFREYDYSNPPGNDHHSIAYSAEYEDGYLLGMPYMVKCVTKLEFDAMKDPFSWDHRQIITDYFNRP